MTTPQSISSINFTPDVNFTRTLAEQILHDQKNKLPELNHVCILLPNAQAVQQMRHSLVNTAQQTLLGGFIGSLTQWLEHNIQPHDLSKKHIDIADRQLLLVEALKQHSELFSGENHWQVCDSLLELFDELNLSQHQWLNADTPIWIEKLQSAYQTSQNIEHLNQEARIIQTLWQAWQQQLDALKLEDDSGTLKQRLKTSLPEHIQSLHFYIVGYEQFSPLEKSWCEHLATQTQVSFIEQNNNAQYAEDFNLSLLNNIYSQHDVIRARAEKFNTIETPCFLNNIRLFDAQSAEQETQAVDLKIRMSLLNGRNNIAVVTENRKLARRLRALLERSNINIQDTAGWSLATTSAATVLERWLECIEQNFAYQPFLDLLKSPFFCAQHEFDDHLKLIYRFEQDIVLHENIANDLNRYIESIKKRSKRLNLTNITTSENLISLLEHVKSTAQKLLDLYNLNTSNTAENWIECFLNSLKELGLYDQLNLDDAGQRVQEELEKLQHAHTTANPQMSWQDLRTWIGSTFEQAQFKPQSQISSVKIMNLQQAQYCQFDTLIIAGANMKTFPGAVSQHPFFNQSVRSALQLKNWQQEKLNKFQQFQQLLMAANDILITWQAEKNGEWMQVSPWVSSLEDFAKIAFNLSLHDKQIESLLKQTTSVTERNDDLLNHIKVTSQASPTAKDKLIPAEYSASRHQRLINCPYQFFAADILQLKPLEEISQELLKSEYGEKVHAILHAFHQQCDGMPKPFTAAITHQNKNDALEHIKKLSHIIFNTQLEDSVQHRSWFDRWMNTAESYINWQIQRQTEWNIYAHESKKQAILNNEIKLSGRLDRIDIQNNQFSIIDYKTGNTAKQKDIELAENIQLTSYATLMENVCEVMYLKIDKGETKQAGILQDDDLYTLKTDVLTRLEKMINEIKSTSPLPSWGDETACKYCNMSGLCRKQMWEVSTS